MCRKGMVRFLSQLSLWTIIHAQCCHSFAISGLTGFFSFFFFFCCVPYSWNSDVLCAKNSPEVQCGHLPVIRANWGRTNQTKKWTPSTRSRLSHFSLSFFQCMNEKMYISSRYSWPKEDGLGPFSIQPCINLPRKSLLSLFDLSRLATSFPLILFDTYQRWNYSFCNGAMKPPPQNLERQTIHPGGVAHWPHVHTWASQRLLHVGWNYKITVPSPKRLGGFFHLQLAICWSKKKNTHTQKAKKCHFIHLSQQKIFREAVLAFVRSLYMQWNSDQGTKAEATEETTWSRGRNSCTLHILQQKKLQGR